MRAKLIHPVKVKFQNVDKSGSTVDADFDEPTALVYKAEIEIEAQVKIYSIGKLEGNVAGFELKGDGYFLVYDADHEAIDYNAKVTSIDGEAVEFYVNDKGPIAFYQSGTKFRRIYFVKKDKGKAA